jgi:Zn-finger nucleic acid-binding protein
MTSCPRCDGSMKTVTETLENGETLSIDVCKDCGGIWAEKGVYQQIKVKRLRQEKEYEHKLKEQNADNDPYPQSWWLFYPHIYNTGSMSHKCLRDEFPRTHGRGIGGGHSRGGGGCVYSCACVSCACAASCACACACAGGGAAGCAPKNKIPQINLNILFKGLGNQSEK